MQPLHHDENALGTAGDGLGEVARPERADVEHGADVWVRRAGQRLGLDAAAAAGGRNVALDRDDLYRDVALQERIPGREHAPHAPSADLLAQPIASDPQRRRIRKQRRAHAGERLKGVRHPRSPPERVGFTGHVLDPL